MHAVGIRNDILAEHPWLPKVLVDAFTQAKNIAEQDLRELRALKIGLPWIVAHTANTEKLMGSNFWAYGVQENKHTLKTILNYTYEQGLSKRKLSIDELFVT
jgi:4,5-dihydroxyphthalate decarboxylase